MAITCIDIPQLVLSGNEVLLKVKTSATLANYTQHEIILTITANGNESSISLPATTYLSKRIAVFDISFALKQTENYNKSTPSYLNSIFPETGMIKYTVTASEKYFDTSTGTWYNSASETTLLEDYYAFDGGLSKQMENNLKLHNVSFYEYYVKQMKWFTNMPDGYTVNHGAPIVLYFGNMVTEQQRSVVFTIHLTNGTTVYQTTHTVNYTATNYTVNELLFSPGFIAIAAGATNPVVQIDVVHKIGTTESEKRTYYVEGEASSNDIYLMYRNSLGGYDCLHVKGEKELTTKAVKQTVATNAYSAEYGTITLKQLEASFVEQHNTDVGYTSAENIAYLTDLLKSDHIVMLNYYVFMYQVKPVLLVTDTGLLQNNIDFDILYNFPLQLIPAYADKYYHENDYVVMMYPPDMLEADEVFRRSELDTVYSDVSNDEITLSESTTYGTMLTFPAGLDQFNMTNRTWWTSNIESQPWYSAITNRTFPLSFFNSVDINANATVLNTQSVFLNTEATAPGFIGDILPIVIYPAAKTDVDFLQYMLFYLEFMGKEALIN